MTPPRGAARYCPLLFAALTGRSDPGPRLTPREFLTKFRLPARPQSDRWLEGTVLDVTRWLEGTVLDVTRYLASTDPC